MLRPNCRTEEERAHCDHVQLSEIERIIFDAMAGLSYINQFVPINACRDIHNIGETLGNAAQNIHAVDRALEICLEYGSQEKYHDEHDREIRETDDGKSRWFKIVDFMRNNIKKGN